MARRCVAEFIGTMWLVLGGCGTAVFAGQYVGYQGVALAFGLTVLTGAYALGHISGGHFNPAVTVGLASGNRFSWSEVPHYVISQVLGGIVGALVIALISAGSVDGFTREVGAVASNGFGHERGFYSLGSALLAEILLTFIFLIVILGVTHAKAATQFAGIAIGLALTLIHLISIPITNTSVNPARSLGPALVEGGDALTQVWLFIVAPVIGAALAGVAYQWLRPNEDTAAA
ncbi:MAG: aquaporin Z [Actinobacteria bacterium]|nr:aquaporin Z [Actinomycetota bacterium]